MNAKTLHALHRFPAVGLALVVGLLLALPLAGQARLRDLVDVEGVRDNTLTGVGLVMGLDDTGDGAALTAEAAANFLRRAGLNTNTAIDTSGMALVMVTAKIPPFARPGSKIDVTVAAIGGAESLRGGQLLQTPLRDPSGQTAYVVADGPLTVGGVSARGQSGSSETINHPTVGRIVNGGQVEKIVEQRMITRNGRINLLLRENSYGLAREMTDAIDGLFPGTARAVDARTIEIWVPEELRADPVRFLADIGELTIDIPQKAVVVINEKTGTIVAGGDVVILQGSISKSNLTIRVQETPEVSQPNPLAEGDTVVVPRSDVEITESSTPLVPLESAVGADELAQSLNALGATTLDLIAIFHALKEAGMLQAEIIVQ